MSFAIEISIDASLPGSEEHSASVTIIVQQEPTQAAVIEMVNTLKPQLAELWGSSEKRIHAMVTVVRVERTVLRYTTV
jgi:hypothetical protein